MTTAVLSDLHLGSPASTLMETDMRTRLLEEISTADRLVLLGDLLSLRAGPLSGVLASAEPFLDDLALAFAGKQIVVVPGNHDHRLAVPLLEEASLAGRDLALTSTRLLTPESPGLERWLARRLPGCQVELAYPGVWIGSDVLAIHGHYMDLHLTVPRLESVAASVIARAIGGLPPSTVGPSDYEAVLAPLYAFADARAGLGQGRDDAPGARAARQAMALGWARMGEGESLAARLRRVAAGVALPIAVAALNAACLGPFRAALSPAEVERAGLRAMADVIERLGVRATHVVFGHTHRAGPLAGDPAWSSPGGSTMINPGGWVLEEVLLGDAGAHSGFAPGRWVEVPDDGPPRLRSLGGTT